MNNVDRSLDKNLLSISAKLKMQLDECRHEISHKVFNDRVREVGQIDEYIHNPAK